MKTMKKTILLAAIVAAASLALGCENDTPTPGSDNGGRGTEIDIIDNDDDGGDVNDIDNDIANKDVDNDTDNDGNTDNGDIDISDNDIDGDADNENNDTDNNGNNENGDINNDGEFLVLTSITAISDYLAEQTGGTSVDNPIDLFVQIDLSNMNTSSNWAALLSTINTQGKYVNLDLTHSTMSRTDFSPRATTAAAGKDKIVSIVLPATATSIATGASNTSAFSSFNNLTTVTLPENLVSIGANAFYNRKTLTTVIMHATTPPELGTGVFTQTHASLAIHVPPESLTAYQNAEGWNDYESIIVEIEIPPLFATIYQ